VLLGLQGVEGPSGQDGTFGGGLGVEAVINGDIDNFIVSWGQCYDQYF
jgi:hypothetical protein